MSLAYAENQAKPEAPNTALPHGWCRMDELAVIRVAAEERAAFLQNMLSNDIHAVDGTTAQLTTQCTPKGRVQALFVALERDDAYLLLLPADNLAATLARLRLFVLRSRVTVEDASETLGCIGLLGRQAAETAAEASGCTHLPDRPWAVRTQGDVSLLRYPGDTPRYLLVLPRERQAEIAATLERQMHPALPFSAWTEHEIEAGLPMVCQATREEFVPQWINLDLLGGLNFRKGCYPGQEVVARLHYLGKPNRRMLAGHGALEQIPAPGTAITDTRGTTIGQVVSAARSSAVAEDCRFLAVVRLGQLEQAACIDSTRVWLDRETLPAQSAQQDESPTTTH